MAENILAITTSSSNKRTERVADKIAQPPQPLRRTGLAAMSAELAAGNHSESSRAKSNKFRSKRGGIRNDFLERLFYISKRKAVEMHALLEKKRARDPQGRKSRAITPRQISSKKSAERCRLQKRIYTQILETRISELTVYNDHTRRVMAALSLETGRTSMRLFDRSRQTHTSVDEKNNIESFAKSPPLTLSQMADMESDSHIHDSNVMDDRVRQAVSTPIATSSAVTNHNMWYPINSSHALLPLKPTINKLPTRRSTGIIYSSTSASQNKLTKDEAFFIRQQEESNAAKDEREEQPGVNISNIHFGELSSHHELDIFLNPMPFEPSPYEFDLSFNFES